MPTILVPLRGDRKRPCFHPVQRLPQLVSDKQFSALNGTTGGIEAPTVFKDTNGTLLTSSAPTRQGGEPMTISIPQRKSMKRGRGPTRIHRTKRQERPG